MSDYSKDKCIELLAAKAKELTAAGESRFPKKSDFSEEEAAYIKSFLGPWPRALEAAGVKEARNDGYIERKREKRIRSKVRKREAKLAARAQQSNSSNSDADTIQ